MYAASFRSNRALVRSIDYSGCVNSILRVFIQDIKGMAFANITLCDLYNTGNIFCAAAYTARWVTHFMMFQCNKLNYTLMHSFSIHEIRSLHSMLLHNWTHLRGRKSNLNWAILKTRYCFPLCRCIPEACLYHLFKMMTAIAFCHPFLMSSHAWYDNQVHANEPMAPSHAVVVTSLIRVSMVTEWLNRTPPMKLRWVTLVQQHCLSLTDLMGELCG